MFETIGVTAVALGIGWRKLWIHKKTQAGARVIGYTLYSKEDIRKAVQEMDQQLNPGVDYKMEMVNEVLVFTLGDTPCELFFDTMEEKNIEEAMAVMF